MYKIPINFSGINKKEKEVEFKIKGMTYKITVRKPIREDKYYMDLSDYSGKQIISNLVCCLNFSLFDFASYKKVFGGYFLVLKDSKAYKEENLVYPMLGNGYSLYYLTFEEVGEYYGL